MKTKAFTLIEVLVTMAIVSIMAGIMWPAVWHFWESEEQATTRERLRELKKGLLGDPTLLQNGIRTDFGFIGDNGELPVAFYNTSTSTNGDLNQLITRPSSGYPFWNGPYMRGGFDPSSFTKDAWGTRISLRLYNTADPYGRYVTADLCSAGPDRRFGTADDICEEFKIRENETIPTNRIQGNVFGNFSSLKISIRFRDPKNAGGESTLNTCKDLQHTSGFINYTTLFVTAANPIRLPIGKLDITTELSHGPNCADSAATNSFSYYLQDNTKIIVIPDLR